MSHTILIIEDEAAIREMVTIALSGAGFELLEAEDAGRADKILALRRPELILLDLMLPDIHGLDFIRRLKADVYSCDIPVIILTARAEESHKIKGLDYGADDYITKPFSPKELIARIKAVLRRGWHSHTDQIMILKNMSLDSSRHRLTVNGMGIELGPTEFRLLQFFLSHREKVYTRAQLLDQVWGRGSYLEERTVDVHIRRLRKSLAPFGYDRYIQTVRGAGYRLSEQV